MIAGTRTRKEFNKGHRPMIGRKRQGPLIGLKVVEFASIGPGPHCAMLLADLGAEVVRIDRPGGNGNPNAVLDRGRATMVVDIRAEEGRKQCERICGKADVVIEGFRPGVMERVGLGPAILCKLNPHLVYARMTGWGQDGPFSRVAGHDINYIALTGALASMGAPGSPPTPPLNLVGDFGGGSVYLAFGIMAALWERQRSGMGQVIDGAVVDGVASMMAMFTGLIARGAISVERDRSLLGGAAHFYRCYACADGRYISIGALEPRFYEQLIHKIGATEGHFKEQYDVGTWPACSDHLATIFLAKSRDEWCALLEGTDCCFAPVLTLAEAPHHEHLAKRGVYFEAAGAVHPAPAPRFSRTPGVATAGFSSTEVLERWGVDLKLSE
jgi:alpha-methylacyl-CoA racemase